MNIWIDGYEANVLQRLGSSKVAFELLKWFERLDKKNEYTILLPEPPLADLPKEREGWHYHILKPKRLWTRVALPWVLFSAKNKPDIFFSPTHYAPRFGKVKRVITIFDLAYLHFPDMFNKKDLYQMTNWTKASIKDAEHIITISQFTKRDIVKNYQVLSKNVTVAYPGYGEDIYKPISDLKKIEEIKLKYKILGKYVLFIGTVQPRKNLLRLIESFIKIDDLKLVVVGKTLGLGRQAWKYRDILDAPEKLGISEKVIFTGFVPDEDMVYLMNGATCFALPSLWEGFGIPVVDAMACGVPVIVSNVSSLPEVVGEAGLLVDPRSITQIEQSIRTISSDKKLRQKKSKLGLVQSKKFSWTKMAKIVLNVFEEVNKQR